MHTLILLKRIALQPTYTIGRFFVNDESNKICDCLEDPVRDYNKDGDLDDQGETKIWGNTAIPYGEYKVTKELHHKFGKCFRIHNVKHFEGIFIHSGNYPKDTHGCPLAGYNTAKGAVMNSRQALDKLYDAVPNGIDVKIKVY